MANDSQDSHRKHLRSPSDGESPEISKHHKHHHHRHHRRHRHHHRSKHHDAEKNATATENKEEIVADVRDIVMKKPLLDYDMEEGEIVEDEGILEVDASIAEKKVGSDVESGELKAGDGGSDIDVCYMSFDASTIRKSSRCLKSHGSDQSGESKDDGRQSHHNELLVPERIVNGDLASRSSKGESRSHLRHKSPRKESGKDKERHRNTRKKPVLDIMEVDDGDGHEDRRNSHSHEDGEICHEAMYRSPSLGRNLLQTTSDTTWSESPDHRRERSQSILHDNHSKTRHRHDRDERMYDNGNAGYEVEDDRDSHAGIFNRPDGGEKANYLGTERSSRYHMSSKHENNSCKGTQEKIYRDKKGVDREPNKERSERDHDRDWEKERHSYQSRDREREKDSVRNRERPGESKSGVDCDRDHGGNRDRDRRREKDHGRSQDRAFERERRRDDIVSNHRDKDREWDRPSDRSRKMEMDMGRDRYSDRDRHRNKARDDDGDRSRRYHKHDDRDDGYGNRDRHRGYDEAEYGKDRRTKHDPDKDQTSKVDSQKEFDDGMYRDDDDQSYHQETLVLKPVEQEEDDVVRIKEESRKRREAILQKYKAKQSQQQHQQQQAGPLVPKASDDQLMEQPSQTMASVKAVQEDSNGIRDNGKSSLGNNLIAVVLGEGSPKSEKSNDMFCDDIFGDSPAGVRKMGKGDDLHLERSGLHDNWDDPEGYYSFRFGEILDSRYEITAAHGKGVFSTVVRAKDLKAGIGDPEEVAIKIIRNNETMLKAGTEELVILKKLVGADPEDRRHCVRYLSHFKYRNHLCIVFESLHMNLREVLKKFGRNIGLKLTAVRTYAKQLFIALKHLRNCGVLHCDIKPDNMLVNDSKNVLKLCDFGNAMFAGKNEITPYLVSRFYRAPEIILGLPYDHPMDIWSVGCCLYELYTGKVLFPGPTNNDMLRLHMELKGHFPKKMLRKGAFIEQHFDQDFNFLAIEEDPVTKKAIRRLLVNIKPKDIGNIIRGSTGEDPKMLANFKDLLDKFFVLDPDKRLTVSQALNHPFITGK